MIKLSRLKTTLLPHQQRVVRKGRDKDLLLVHSLGSGKTLSSIAIADNIGKPTVVFTPAPLVENFKKEIKKHTTGDTKFDVVSLPTAVSRGYKVPKGATVIVDEAHMLRNRGTDRSRYVENAIKDAGRVIGLTGTPVYNDPYDIAQLVNLISRTEEFPTDRSEFSSKYLSENIKDPGFFAKWFYGVKPGKVTSLKPDTDLGEKLRRHIDFEETRRELPTVEDETKYVDMSPQQVSAYNYVTRNLPFPLLYKLRHNIAPNKREAKQLNAFLSGVRQVSNTPEAISVDDTDSPKLNLAASELINLLRKNRRARAFVYSNYIGSGVLPYSKLLDQEKIKYNIFDGSLSDEDKKRIVDEYNSGRTPVILGTGSASEGLDLKNTRLIQLLEPHWNESRLKQVIGRGARYKSHDELPEDERNVKVQRFISRLPERGLLWKRRKTSVDEYLTSRSREKQELADAIKSLLKQER